MEYIKNSDFKLTKYDKYFGTMAKNNLGQLIANTFYDFGGISEDVLKFIYDKDFKDSKYVDKIMPLIKNNADVAWYKLIIDVINHKEDTSALNYIDEIILAYEKGIPSDVVTDYYRECKTLHQMAYAREQYTSENNYEKVIDEVNNVSGVLQKLENEDKKRNENLGKLEEKYINQEKNLKAAAENLEKEKEKIKEEIDQTYKEKLSDIKDECAYYREKYESTNKKLKEVKRELALEKENKTDESNITELEKENTTLKEKISKLSAENEELKKKNQEVESQKNNESAAKLEEITKSVNKLFSLFSEENRDDDMYKFLNAKFDNMEKKFDNVVDFTVHSSDDNMKEEQVYKEDLDEKEKSVEETAEEFVPELEEDPELEEEQKAADEKINDEEENNGFKPEFQDEFEDDELLYDNVEPSVEDEELEHDGMHEMEPEDKSKTILFYENLKTKYLEKKFYRTKNEKKRKSLIIQAAMARKGNSNKARFLNKINSAIKAGSVSSDLLYGMLITNKMNDEDILEVIGETKVSA